MLTIQPKITCNKNNYAYQVNSKKSVNEKGVQTDFKSELPIYYNDIAFKGWCHSRKNAIPIKQIVDLIKSTDVNRIAVFAHKRIDIDGAATELALAQMIREATGKTVDVFVLKPLEKKLKFLEKYGHFNIVNEILGEHCSEQQIIKKFGTYDLALSVDTASSTLFDEKLYNALFKKAKHKVKIDHHPVKPANKNEPNKNEHYADINFVDESKESAAQVVMEMAKALGLNTRRIRPQIRHCLMAGLVSDSRQFALARTPAIFLDAAKLSKNGKDEIAKTIDEVSTLTAQELDDYVNCLRSKHLVNKGKIAYFVVDLNEKVISDRSIYKALNDLVHIDSVNYSFVIIKRKNGELKISLRSNDKPLLGIANLFGGGGHEHMCAFTTSSIGVNDAAKNIVASLTELSNLEHI